MRLIKANSADKTAQRKQDARHKIELGGLVIKAGLRHADKAFILGALIHAAALPLHSPERQRLTSNGGEFLMQGNDKNEQK